MGDFAVTFVTCEWTFRHAVDKSYITCKCVCEFEETQQTQYSWIMYSTVFFYCQSGMSQVTAKTNSSIGIESQWVGNFFDKSFNGIAFLRLLSNSWPLVKLKEIQTISLEHS